MGTQSRDIKEHRQQAAAAFGRMCARWRAQQAWSQYVGENWSRQAGFDVLTHGGLSPLEAGKVSHPRWGLFAHFAEMNRRLQARDFSGVKSQDLKAKLATATPMVDDDGRLLQEEELCGIHMGIRRIPAALWVPPTTDAPSITQIEAMDLCDGWRKRVTTEARRRGAGLVRVLGEVGQQAPLAERDLFQDVLAEVASYSPDQLRRLWDGYDWKPKAWIENWACDPRNSSAIKAVDVPTKTPLPLVQQP